jgi:hypothetical protein
VVIHLSILGADHTGPGVTERIPLRVFVLELFLFAIRIVRVVLVIIRAEQTVVRPRSWTNTPARWKKSNGPGIGHSTTCPGALVRGDDQGHGPACA